MTAARDSCANGILCRVLTTLLFDLDGTLVDSVADLHAAAARMLDDLHRAPLSLAQVRGFIGNGVEVLVERCLRATGAGGDLGQAVSLFHRHYSAEPALRTEPYPGVASALLALREAGLKLGVCTNKPQALAESILASLNLLPLFAAVVGGNGTRALKPDPAALQECRTRLQGSPEETVHVGDSEVDEEAAMRAGLAFALFSGGYRQKSAAAMRTAFIFDRYEQLPEWVLAKRSP